MSPPPSPDPAEVADISTVDVNSVLSDDGMGVGEVEAAMDTALSRRAKELLAKHRYLRRCLLALLPLVFFSVSIHCPVGVHEPHHILLLCRSQSYVILSDASCCAGSPRSVSLQQVCEGLGQIWTSSLLHGSCGLPSPHM